MVCTFFGHRECYGLEARLIQDEIEKLIDAGVDTFYVGNQGNFDRMALHCLRKICENHPHIRFAVVLAYLPQDGDGTVENSLYPEGMEEVPRRFAIEKRNRWMMERANYCLCFVTHKWGGAYKFARLAKRKGLTVINLGNVVL